MKCDESSLTESMYMNMNMNIKINIHYYMFEVMNIYYTHSHLTYPPPSAPPSTNKTATPFLPLKKAHDSAVC